MRSKKSWDSWDIVAVNTGKGQPNGKGRGKGKSQEPTHFEKLRKDENQQDRKCFVCGNLDTLPKTANTASEQ